MTPEKAQQKTEAKWKAIAGGDESVIGSDCGWCEFVGSRICSTFCPVFRVHGYHCSHLPVYEIMLKAIGDDVMDAAQQVYEFLRQMGPTYIAKAKEMERGE